MDLTPFLTNVGRVADALERIALVLESDRTEIVGTPEDLDGTPGWMKALFAGGVTQLRMEPRLLLSPGIEESQTAVLGAIAASHGLAVKRDPIVVEAKEATPPTAVSIGNEVRALYDAGITTMTGIANALNAKGVQTERGAKFYQSSVAVWFRRLGLKSTGRDYGAKPAAVPGLHPFRRTRRRALPPPVDRRSDQDLITDAIAAGRVRTMPSCTDSYGFNHKTGQAT